MDQGQGPLGQRAIKARARRATKARAKAFMGKVPKQMAKDGGKIRAKAKASAGPHKEVVKDATPAKTQEEARAKATANSASTVSPRTTTSQNAARKPQA